MTRNSLCSSVLHYGTYNVIKAMAGISDDCLSELNGNNNISTVIATLKPNEDDQVPAALGIDELNPEGLLFTLPC